MSSTTRLLVLGVVRIFQPVHGYVVRRELVTWRAQDWASIKPGSIYNALKTLSRDGYLEVVGTDQVGGRPERTTYRLTAVGEEEFRLLLREEWWTVRPPIDPLMAAISFIGFVTRGEAIAALEHRTSQIQGMVRHTEFAIEAHDGVDSPHHVREMMRLMNARLASEIAWANQLVARLRNHEYSTADDPPWLPAHVQAAQAKPPRARTRPRAVAARAGAAGRDEPSSAARTAGSRDPARPRAPGARARRLEPASRARDAKPRGAIRKPVR